MFGDDSPFPAFELSFKDVTCQRGSRLLFQDLSFKLNAGELLWIQGANGVGKTSILRLAAGFFRPAAGEIALNGHPVAHEASSLIALQSHHDGFEPDFNVWEELDFWRDIYEYDGDLSALMNGVGLTEQKKVKVAGLSAGQKRRLALARLFLTNRPLWLLDEPKAAMDKLGQKLIDASLEWHLSRGGSALIATHNMARPAGRKSRRLLLEASQ